MRVLNCPCLVALGLALACVNPPDSGHTSGADAAGVDAGSIALQRASYSDTLRAVLDRLATMYAPVIDWQDRALTELRSDSGTARADTVFLRLRLEARDVVRRTGPAFNNDRELQAFVYPEGGWANVLRRERGERGVAPEPVALARADTVRDWLRARGLLMYRAEGDAYVELDELGLLESFGSFLSAGTREFLRIWALDQHGPVAGDAAVRIAPDELARRIFDAEQFLAQYPASPVRERVAERYRWYLWIYFGGLPNTPAFDRRTGALRDELRRSYERYIVEHPSSQAAALVSEYLALLDRSGFRRILGRLTAASRSREAAALAAADHVLARTDEVPFEDFVAVENLLLQMPRAPHSDSSVLDVSPLLQFRRLQIPDRAARAPGRRSSGSRRFARSSTGAATTCRSGKDPLKSAWFHSRRDLLRYFEPDGAWSVDPEVYWELYERHRQTQWAEEMAWAAARADVRGDECGAACVLTQIERTYARYWSEFPRSAHVGEALTRLATRAGSAVPVVGCYHADVPAATGPAAAVQDACIILNRFGISSRFQG